MHKRKGCAQAGVVVIKDQDHFPLFLSLCVVVAFVMHDVEQEVIFIDLCLVLLAAPLRQLDDPQGDEVAFDRCVQFFWPISALALAAFGLAILFSASATASAATSAAAFTAASAAAFATSFALLLDLLLLPFLIFSCIRFVDRRAVEFLQTKVPRVCLSVDVAVTFGNYVPLKDLAALAIFLGQVQVQVFIT